MPSRLYRSIVLALAVVWTAQAFPQDPGDPLIVTKKTTKMRKAKRLYAPGVQDLVEGDKVALVKREGSWCLVTYQEAEGWLHESDLTAKLDVKLSGEGVREDYTAAETSAARKGFNKDIEANYKNKRGLGAAYRIVDAIQARILDEALLVEFMKEGKLIEGGE